MGLLQALHTIVCGTRSDQASGALPFYGFPNEMLKPLWSELEGHRYNSPSQKFATGWLKSTRKAVASLSRTS